VQGSAEQAQATAARAQQSATDARRLADQASSRAAEAKTALAVVDKESKAEDKRVSALQDLVGRFRISGDIRLRVRTSFRIVLPASCAIRPAFASVSRCRWTLE
jgi:hypothetical protein